MSDALVCTAKADISALVPAPRARGTYEWLRGRPKKAHT